MFLVVPVLLIASQYSTATAIAAPEERAASAVAPMSLSSPPPVHGKNPKLDSGLVAVDQESARHGSDAGLAEAQRRGFRTPGELVKVVIEADDPHAVADAVTRLGGRGEAQWQHLLQALVPPSELDRIADLEQVRYVRPPFRSVPQAVAGQGITATNAAAWQAAGITGVGVKVGIIDLGFYGYFAAQSSGDLPSTLTLVNYCPQGFTYETDHGTAVAEIVHEIAPGTQMYLICIDTEVTLAQAESYAKSQGISIINHSVGWPNTSRGDGSGRPGTPDATVADARANGILWVNAAGNHAEQHWQGVFADTDLDGYHNFSGIYETNPVQVGPQRRICAFLKWDSWPATSSDYDLGLFSANQNGFVAASVNPQTGSQPPKEGACYTNTSGVTDSVGAVIILYAGQSGARLDLFTTDDLYYQVAAGSVLEPASSAAAFAVGAICWQGDLLESFSSRGPTIDGRTKPDIAGPDSVSSYTYGPFGGCGSPYGFPGTSAASPHVAGAAALVKQQQPSWGPAQIQSFLESRAADLGTPGKDTSYGAGKLTLGQPTAGYLLSVVRAGSGTGTVTSTPSGIGCGTSCSATFPSGTVVTLVASPASGSTFAGWSGPCSGTGSCSLTMNAQTSVTATFSTSGSTTNVLSVTLSGAGFGRVISDPAGIDCASSCSASFPAGSNVTLTAMPSSGSVFDGWGGSCGGTSTCIVSMGSARSVMASFSPGPAVQFSAPSYSVSEVSGQALISVSRSGNASSGLSVQYATSDGTASAGSDYTSAVGTLSFSPGQVSASFAIPITDDSFPEGDETIMAALSSPSGGALGSPSTAVIRIGESDRVMRPDSQVKLSGDATYVGNNIYNSSGSGQQRTAGARRGTRATFYLRIQNDGNISDSFRVRAAGSSSAFYVHYFSGSTDITNLVTGAGYVSRALSPTSGVTLRLEITVRGSASIGTIKSWLVTAISQQRPVRLDAIVAKVKVTN